MREAKCSALRVMRGTSLVGADDKQAARDQQKLADSRAHKCRFVQPAFLSPSLAAARAQRKAIKRRGVKRWQQFSQVGSPNGAQCTIALNEASSLSGSSSPAPLAAVPRLAATCFFCLPAGAPKELARLLARSGHGVRATWMSLEESQHILGSSGAQP